MRINRQTVDLENQFGSSFRARWCLLVPVGEPRGAHWCLTISLFLNPLVPRGACWCMLVPVGACWCLLVPVGRRRRHLELRPRAIHSTAHDASVHDWS